MKLFRGTKGSPQQTAVAMLGVRPGDSVVVLGASDPPLAGAIGAMTGLNGQTTVVDRAAGAAGRIAAAAGAAGALVDFKDAPLTLLTLDPNRFDAAILPAGLSALGADAPLVLAEAIRVVRPGGRVALCEPTSRPGLFRLLQTPRPTIDPASVTQRLIACGLRAARHVGDIEGVSYFEGVKPRERAT